MKTFITWASVVALALLVTIGPIAFADGIQLTSTIDGSNVAPRTVTGGYSSAGNTVVIASTAATACYGSGGATVGNSCVSSNGWTWWGDSTSMNFYYGNQVRLTGAVGSGAWSTPYAFSGSTITGNSALALAASATLNINSRAVYTSTAPTISNGCTGEAMTWNAGTATFQFDVGTSCTGISTTVITLPDQVTANHGYVCRCDNLTTAARNIADTAWSTSSITITNTDRTTGLAVDFVDGDDIRCTCSGG